MMFQGCICRSQNSTQLKWMESEALHVQEQKLTLTAAINSFRGLGVRDLPSDTCSRREVSNNPETLLIM
jgi:hypothetical protein